MSEATWLGDTRVCICVGAGGVGKTTVAAAVALGGALRGRKVAAITIDPAPRLAESLGLQRLENEPTRVPLDGALDLAAGMPRPHPAGQLWAMRLDVRRTLDELVDLLLPDPGARRQLLANRVYRQLADAVAGTHELMAIAKLYELDRAGDYDLLVLDTPPSRSALDFLDAPDRLARFLRSRSLQALLRSAGAGTRLFGGGSAAALRLLTRVTGVEMLDDIGAFLVALGDMRGGIRERAEQVQALLRDPASAFLLVTVAEPGPAEETIFLARALRAAHMSVAHLVVNQVHHDTIAAFDVERLQRELRENLGPKLACRVAENLRDYHRRVERGRESERRLQDALGVADPIRIPQLDEDPSEPAGLASVGRFLFADEAERARLLAEVVS